MIPKEPELLEDLGMRYPTETSKRRYRFGRYLCYCGTEFEAVISNVKDGVTKSCGCYKKVKISEANTTHGFRGHPLYQTWSGMIQRTTNSKRRGYDNYGGRGITVCERWQDIANFIHDMYPTYSEGLTLDRIDIDGNYGPDNCRWATKETQARNTRLIMSTNTSGYRGVSFRKDNSKWSAQISINGHLKHLGTYLTAEDAAMAYDQYVIDNNLGHTINGVKGSLT